MDKTHKKKITTEYIPMALAFIGILSCAIIFKQDWYKTLPLCFSLYIVLVNSHANRIGFLLGAMNSFIYIVGYFTEGLYGTVLTTLVGAMIQIASFFCWKKNSYKKATKFRLLNNKERGLLVVGILAIWGICSFVLYNINGTEYVLDGLTTVLGVIVPIMQMLAIIEALPLSIFSCFIHLIIWIRIILSGNIANFTYLVSSIYGLYMQIRMALKWIELYKEQQNEESES